MCAVIAAGLSWRLSGAASVRFHGQGCRQHGERGEYGRLWRCFCAALCMLLWPKLADKVLFTSPGRTGRALARI